MKANVGTLDRSLRIASGLILIALSLAIGARLVRCWGSIPASNPEGRKR
ncbi:DUF2892 domain-containing protein [Pseudomonas sp. MDMC_285]|nr:DUF2892 domain-containing protein [Pseudomonas sp. MDMC_285]